MTSIKDLLYILIICCLLFSIWWLWRDNNSILNRNAELVSENEAYKLQIETDKANIDILEKKILDQNKKIETFYEESRKYKEEIENLNNKNESESEEIEKRYQDSTGDEFFNEKDYLEWLKEKSYHY